MPRVHDAARPAWAGPRASAFLEEEKQMVSKMFRSRSIAAGIAVLALGLSSVQQR